MTKYSTRVKMCFHMQVFVRHSGAYEKTLFLSSAIRSDCIHLLALLFAPPLYSTRSLPGLLLTNVKCRRPTSLEKHIFAISTLPQLKIGQLFVCFIFHHALAKMVVHYTSTPGLHLGVRVLDSFPAKCLGSSMAVPLGWIGSFLPHMILFGRLLCAVLARYAAWGMPQITGYVYTKAAMGYRTV